MCVLVTYSTRHKSFTSLLTYIRHFHISLCSNCLGTIFIPRILRDPDNESLWVGPQKPAWRPRGPEASAEGSEEAPNKETVEQILNTVKLPFDVVYPVRLFDVAKAELEP